MNRHFLLILLLTLISNTCLAVEDYIVDEELSKEIRFTYMYDVDNDFGRLIISIPIKEGYVPQKCLFFAESFDEPLELRIFKDDQSYGCSLSYGGKENDKHTVKIHYRGTNQITVGEYTHNKAL